MMTRYLDSKAPTTWADGNGQSHSTYIMHAKNLKDALGGPIIPSLDQKLIQAIGLLLEIIPDVGAKLERINIGGSEQYLSAVKNYLKSDGKLSDANILQLKAVLAQVVTGLNSDIYVKVADSLSLNDRITKYLIENDRSDDLLKIETELKSAQGYVASMTKETREHINPKFAAKPLHTTPAIQFHHDETVEPTIHGAIHLSASILLSEIEDVCRVVLHESLHKYAGLLDLWYVGSENDTCGEKQSESKPKDEFTTARALANADSVAVFCLDVYSID